MKKIYLFVILSLVVKASVAQCAFTLNATKTDVSCYGGSNGSVTISVTGGTGPFTYSWKSGAGTLGNTTNNLTGIAAGTYTALVTDASVPCTDSAVFIINQPSQLIVPGAFVVQTGCFGLCNGGLTVSVGGGTAPYTFLWTNNSGQPSQNSQTAFNLCPGMYTVTVTDAMGCTDSANTFLPSAPPISINFTTTQNPLCGQCNGAVSANVSGGNPSYTFNWSGPSGYTSTITQPNNLCAGTYTLSVSDAMGCVEIASVGLTSTPTINTFYTSVIPSACGQNNGSIKIDSVVGCCGPYGYLFHELDGSIVGGNCYPSITTFSNLAAGSYTLEVGANYSCMTTQNITVNNSNFNVQLTPTQPSCNACDGAIATAITGGSAPYSYLWSNAAVTNNISNLCTGNYQLTVTDSAGCLSYANTGLIPQNAPIINTDTIVNITCNGVTSGAISISVTGGVGPYTYAWSNGATTPTITGLQSAMYSVTVADANGCTSTRNIYVSNSNNIAVYPTQLTNINCLTNGSATVQAYGGLAPYSYSWNNGATGSTQNNLTASTYTITATDANGCNGTGSVYITSACLNLIKGRVYNDANQNCIQDIGELGLANRVVSASPGYNYGYTDGNGDYIIQTTLMNPTITVYNNYTLYYSPTCPATGSSTVNFSALGDTINNVNFGYYTNPNYFDLSIHPGWTSSYPGSSKTYWCYFANSSPNTQNVIVRFIYDPALQYDSCNSGGVNFPAQHKIEWTFNNVPANAGWDWIANPRAYFTVPASVSIYDSLQAHFEILPIIGDAYPSDNTLDIAEPVTGSRDPNKKSVIPQGVGPNGNILRNDSTLLYTIHFQNNGNDTAFTVVVEDTLSPFLDPATIVPGASSHPYTFDLSGTGLARWTFSQIMLPDSLTNEPASNGYFNYTIKQKINNPYGSSITNTAYIYFDFNSAVVTNTTLNTIVAPTDIADHLIANGNFIMYPNPTQNAVMLQFETKEEGTMKIELFNLMGELIKSQQLSNKQKGKNLEHLDISGFSNGIYLVKLSSASQQSVQKLIIQK